jgi:hypothetical protein
MTLEQFRVLMTQRWRDVEREAQGSRDPNLATFAFGDWYAGLSREERALADEVLSEWVHSADEGQQFDALAAIRRFKIKSVLPSLERLRVELGDARGPQTPFLRAKVDRLLTFLRTGDESNGEF